MNKLLKQINDIQSQLNALQGDLINLLPAITFAEEMFSSRGLSDEETCSYIPPKPEADKTKEVETKSVTKRKKLQLKAEATPEATLEATPEPTPQQSAEIIANTQRLIDKSKELLAAETEQKPPLNETETQSLEGATLSYDDFKNAIYAFIKEDTLINKPIVLGIFKERGYGFTSDVPETDYQLVLDLIKERG